MLVVNRGDGSLSISVEVMFIETGSPVHCGGHHSLAGVLDHSRMEKGWRKGGGSEQQLPASLT